MALAATDGNLGCCMDVIGLKRVNAESFLSQLHMTNLAFSKRSSNTVYHGVAQWSSYELDCVRCNRKFFIQTNELQKLGAFLIDSFILAYAK